MRTKSKRLTIAALGILVVLLVTFAIMGIITDSDAYLWGIIGVIIAGTLVLFIDDLARLNKQDRLCILEQCEHFITAIHTELPKQIEGINQPVNSHRSNDILEHTGQLLNYAGKKPFLKGNPQLYWSIEELDTRLRKANTSQFTDQTVRHWTGIVTEEINKLKLKLQ